MLTPEFELVLACSAWPRDSRDLERIAYAVGRGVDWLAVSKIAQRHRVSALVHHALKRELPPETFAHPGLQTLARESDTNMRHALLQTAESARLLKVFTQAGVQPLFLKGVTLSVLAFGNVSLRHARDIDLLVKTAEIGLAEAVLLSAGYELAPEEGASGAPLQERMRLHKDFEYVHPVKRTRVELHWRPFIYRGLSEAVATAGARPVAIAPGVSLPTLSDEDLLPYLCMHGATHSWNRLKWVADVCALLGRRPEGYEEASAALLRQARLNKVAQPVEQALLLNRKLFARPRSLPQVGWQSHLLTAVALRSMIAGAAVIEPLEVPLESTLTTLSSLLLRPRFSYLTEVAHYVIYAPHRQLEKPPTGLPRFAYPVWRVFRWAERKLWPRVTRAWR